MSGIVACFDRTTTERDRNRLDEMLAQIAHRGPDGGGRIAVDSVGLGQQHHATTPAARHADPPYTDGDLVGVADVRLDNRAELLSALDTDSPATDGELVLAAYDRWGPECPTQLLGAFAIVIWDSERRRLYCARDHMGIKPLYTAVTTDRFVAASEPAPIVDCTEHTPQPDERRVGDFLCGQYGSGTRTFYTSLDRLPPGHWMVVTDEEVRLQQYWSPKPATLDSTANPAAYDRRFRELFSEAVACRLRTIDPVGSLLSGGLDSSSISGVAQQQLAAADRPALRTFSATFDTVSVCDESAYIESVLADGAFEPRFVAGDEVDPLAGLTAHLRRRQAPYYPSLFMLVWRLYQAVEASDTTVVLQGYGGDQTMGSDTRGYLRGLARRGDVRTLIRELEGHARRQHRSPGALLWTDVLRPLAPSPVRAGYHRWRGFDYVDTEIASIDRSFATRSGLDDRLAEAAKRAEPRSQRELRRRALTRGEVTFNLELANIAGAQFGVEPRYPYLDKRLVEFSLALPAGTTVTDGLDRMVVRRGLADVLPTAVRERDDKAAFGPNVVHCTRACAMDHIDTVLFDGPIAADRYLDTNGLRRSRERLTNGDVSAGRDLLMATVLESWVRDHCSVRDDR